MKLKAICFYSWKVDTGNATWEDVTQRFNPRGDNVDLGPEGSHEVTELEKERLAVLKLLTETTYVKDVGFVYKYADNDFAYVVIREHQE